MNDNNSPDSPQFNRRQVLKTLAATAVCPMVAGCEFADVRDDEAVAESSFSIGDAGYEDLAEVGGTACHDHGSQPLLLVRTGEDEIAAFDRICPHQNLDMGPCDSSVPAEWEADDEMIVCNWHGSRFSLDGTFQPELSDHGDDVEDIPTFPVDFDPSTGRGTVSL